MEVIEQHSYPSPSSPNSSTSSRKSIHVPNFIDSSSSSIDDNSKQNNSIPAYASPKSIRQLRDSFANSPPSKSPLAIQSKTNSCASVFPQINVSNAEEADHPLEESKSLSWKGQSITTPTKSKRVATSPLSIFPESSVEMLQVATSPTRGRRFSDNAPFFPFQSVSDSINDEDNYRPGCLSSPKRRAIAKQFEDVSSPTTSSTNFADIKTRKRGNTLPVAYQPKVHKCIPKQCQKTVFEIIFHRDLFIEVSEFLEWKDLLSLTHSCALLFDMGSTHSFVWKHKILSTHKLLNTKLDKIEETVREKSIQASNYCHFETFREVYDSLSVAAENKSIKCFEQLFEIMHIEGTQYSKKSRRECNEKWSQIEQLLSRGENGERREISMAELKTNLFPFPLPSYPPPDESEFNQFQSPINTNSMAHLIEKTASIYENIKYPMDWKGIVEYFYSAESFYDACLADFTKIKKTYEYFHLSFKPYPELLIMHSHYLNYNENAKPAVFTSPVRAFVGWSFFYGKFLEVNIDLISQRQYLLQERNHLERVVLPFIFKKLERDNSN